jgi:heme/copper-type cytochrome/quinol oxidase subunit 2
MAELHVQRKRNSFLWLWMIIIVIVLILAGLFIYDRYNHRNSVLNAKPTSQMKTNISITKTIEDV